MPAAGRFVSAAALIGLLAAGPARAACPLDRRFVCHARYTMCVTRAGLAAHLRHGDLPCACAAAGPFHPDEDADGFGSPGVALRACKAPRGWVRNGRDCDDRRPAVNPGAVEICNNGRDDDCEPRTDCSLAGPRSLDGADAVFGGVAEGDLAGRAAAVGDVDGDGAPDLLVGAPLASVGGTSAGAAYLVYGPLVPGAHPLVAAPVVFRGRDAEDQAGWAVALADLSGDGLDDVILGVRQRGLGPGARGGAVHVFFGPVAAGELPVGAADATLEGAAAGDLLGAALAAGGDANGDGLPDLLIGAPGRDSDRADTGALYLVHGPLVAGPPLSIEAVAAARIDGTELQQSLGRAVAFAGDLDADGHDELLFGSEGHGAWLQYGPVAGRWRADEASVVFGPGPASVLPGFALAGGADLDADGFADVVITDRDDQGAAWSAGAAYVFRGPLTPGRHDLAQADVTLTGAADADMAGSAIAAPGDLDGDGFDDLVVGAWSESSAGDQAGAAYLVYGPLAAGARSLSAADAMFTGPLAYDHAGDFVGAAGDVNGDGRPDLLVGATAAGGTGALFLVFGRGP